MIIIIICIFNNVIIFCHTYCVIRICARVLLARRDPSKPNAFMGRGEILTCHLTQHSCDEGPVLHLMHHAVSGRLLGEVDFFLVQIRLLQEGCRCKGIRSFS